MRLFTERETEAQNIGLICPLGRGQDLNGVLLLVSSHHPLTMHEALPQAGGWAALGQPLASKHGEASHVSSLEHGDA